ncbi:TIGR00730 family Rossman fold protein [Candidatus Saccharibacteria bacterium]|nr:TIGR00730 family Rossman fold protein [Candidatus Saccharibacteria bacterium]
MDKLYEADAERAEAYKKDLEQGLRELRTFSQGVTIFGSARVAETDKFYKKARELGGLLAQNGHSVITGGGPGIMEAANRGAFEYGGRSIGLNISLPYEQQPNPYLTDVLNFHYFFARKVMLTMSSKVFVGFPGGFGTLDEMSELICLMQTKKMPTQPIFLIGKSFWRPMERFINGQLLGGDYIDQSDTELYTVTDDINQVIDAANKIGHVKVTDSIYD